MNERFRPGWWTFAVIACTAVLVLAMLPPFVGPGFRHTLMQGFDLTCHQIPERSFHIGGIQFALCHRCTGVVVGLVLGSLALAVFKDADGSYVRHARVILAISLLPMTIDWGVDAVGLWANVPFSRAATGFVFGVLAGYTFARALAIQPFIHSNPQPVLVAQPPRPSHPTSIQHA